MTLGDRFKHLRISRSITQEQLAEMANVGRSTVSALENGETLKLDTLRVIAKPLQLSEAEWLALVVDWIHNEVGKDFPKLTISTKGTDSGHLPGRVSELFFALSPKAQEEIVTLLKRPHIGDVIRLINRLYEAVDKS
jgi:transcriptional regulator with XRE-family HTH domain